MSSSKKRYFKLWRTIQGRFILVIILVSLLGLIGSQLLVWLVLEPELEKESKDTFSNTADLIALHLEDWWKTRRDFLFTLSVDPTIRDIFIHPELDPQIIAPFIQRLSLDWGVYSVFLFSQDRGIIFSGPAPLSSEDLPIDKLTQAGAFFSFTFNFSRIQAPFLALVANVLNREGETAGRVGLLFDLKTETKTLLSFPRKESLSGECLLGEKEGERILALSELRFKEADGFPFYFPEPQGVVIPMRKAVEGQSGTEKAIDYRGVPALASYRFIIGPNWGLVVKEDWAEVMKPARDMAWQAVMAISGFTLLLIGLAYWINSNSLKPLRELERRARLLAKGEEVALEIKDPEEIESLARSLKEMVREIKARDQALLDYERRWSQLLLDNPQAMIISIDREGKIVSFNKASEEILGYHREEVTGHSFFDLLSPPTRGEAIEFFQNLNISQVPTRTTLELETKSGETRTIEWFLTILESPDGSFQSIVGIGLDLTEREKILNDLNRQVRRLDLLNSINQEIIISDLRNLKSMAANIREVLDAHTVLIFATDRERKTLSPLGWNWRPGYYEIPDEVFVERLPRTTEKGIVGYCIREGEPVVSGDAERHPRAYHIEGTDYLEESVIAMPLRFQEEVLGAILVGKMGLNQFKKEDVALLQTIAGSLAVALHNREVMLNLKEEEERFRNLFESMPDGVVIYDPEGRIIEVNNALCRTLEYSREELVGKKVEDLDHPESKSLALPFLEEVKEKGRARKELLNITKNGEPVPVEVFATKIQYQGKTAFLGVSRDLRERKKLEQIKDDLLYAISHEMKTPIQSLMAAVEIYSSLAPANFAARSAELFEIFKRNILRLKQLVNNFLDAQKLDSESIQLSEKLLEIKPLILETQELLKPYAVLNEVSFQNDFEEDLPPVPGDHERLVEVFTNLYSNAIRFSPKRGTIATSIRKKAQFLEIEITDQGPGIPKEELPHLFERFYRPQSPKLKPLAGTGLGLYLSRLIVEKHGGTIVVESEEEQGTRVIFSLPLQQT